MFANANKEFMGKYSAYSMAKTVFDGLTGQTKPIDPYENNRGVPVFSMNDTSSNIPLPSHYGEELLWTPEVVIKPVNMNFMKALNKPFTNLNSLLSRYEAIIPKEIPKTPLVVDFSNLTKSLQSIQVQEKKTSQLQQQALKNINVPNFDFSILTKSLQAIQEKENAHFNPFSSVKIDVFEQNQKESSIGFLIIPIILLFFFRKVIKK